MEVSRLERSQQTLWDREYEARKVIPSSTRQSPSKALLAYDRLVDFGRYSQVLDAGCGNGRNAIFLASKGCSVDAVDFSATALGIAKERIAAARLGDRIRTQRHSLRNRWPVPDEHYDLVLDSFVSCHLLHEAERQAYLREQVRVIRPGGLLYSSVFGIDDSYYSNMMRPNNRKSRIILDRSNGIRKYLYAEHEFRAFYAKHFRILFFMKLQFEDIVRGKLYCRSIMTLLLEK